MILLQAGANNVVVTLKEKATLANPTYVFLFEHDATKQRYACYSTDLSGFPDRFNKFIITVQASPVWSSGQIYPDDYGFFHYYVYETSNAGALVEATFKNTDVPDTLPTGVTSLVEQGKMKYQAPTETTASYKDTADPIKSYGN